MDSITQAAIMETPLDDGMDKLDLEDAGGEPATTDDVPHETSEGEVAPVADVEAKPDEAKAEAKTEPEPEPAEEEDPKAVIAAVKAELEQLRKENQGLLGKGQAEKEKRQQLEGRVAQMTDFLKGLQSAKAEAEKPPEPKFRGLPIVMTEDGEAYVPQEEIDKYLKSQLKPIESKITGTSAKVEQSELAKSTDAAVSKILAQNPAYPEAFKTVQGAWDDLAGIIMKNNGGKLPPILTDPILKAVKNPAVKNAFREKHPGVNLNDLVVTYTALDPEVWGDTLKDMLDAHIKPKEAPAKETPKPTAMDPRQKALAQKPRTPAGVRGAVGPQPTEFEQIARMGTRQFVKEMDERRMAELDRLLEAEG